MRHVPLFGALGTAFVFLAMACEYGCSTSTNLPSGATQFGYPSWGVRWRTRFGNGRCPDDVAVEWRNDDSSWGYYCSWGNGRCHRRRSAVHADYVS